MSYDPLPYPFTPASSTPSTPSTPTIRRLERNMEYAQRQLAQAVEAAARAEAAAMAESIRRQEEEARRAESRAPFGADLVDSAVIQFTLRFNPRGQEYTYAGVRVDGGWYITNRKTQGAAWTWERLVDWWVTKGVTPDQVWVVSEYVPLDSVVEVDEG